MNCCLAPAATQPCCPSAGRTSHRLRDRALPTGLRLLRRCGCTPLSLLMLRLLLLRPKSRAPLECPGAASRSLLPPAAGTRCCLSLLRSLAWSTSLLWWRAAGLRLRLGCAGPRRSCWRPSGEREWSLLLRWRLWRRPLLPLSLASELLLLLLDEDKPPLLLLLRRRLWCFLDRFLCSFLCSFLCFLLLWCFLCFLSFLCLLLLLGSSRCSGSGFRAACSS